MRIQKLLVSSSFILLGFLMLSSCDKKNALLVNRRTVTLKIIEEIQEAQGAKAQETKQEIERARQTEQGQRELESAPDLNGPPVNEILGENESKTEQGESESKTEQGESESKTEQEESESKTEQEESEPKTELEERLLPILTTQVPIPTKGKDSSAETEFSSPSLSFSSSSMGEIDDASKATDGIFEATLSKEERERKEQEERERKDREERERKDRERAERIRKEQEERKEEELKKRKEWSRSFWKDGEDWKEKLEKQEREKLEKQDEERKKRREKALKEHEELMEAIVIEMGTIYRENNERIVREAEEAWKKALKEVDEEAVPSPSEPRTVGDPKKAPAGDPPVGDPPGKDDSNKVEPSCSLNV